MPTAQEAGSWALISGSLLLIAVSTTLLAIGLYRLLLQKFLTELGRTPGAGLRGAISLLINKLGGVSRRLLRPRYESILQRSLIRAGEPKDLKPLDIIALQEIGLVSGLAAGLLACHGIGVNLAGSLVLSALGGCYPLLWLKDQIRKRQLLITRALPYHLDLLTLAVEAGLDFTGALGKVVERGKAGPLRDELQLVLKQLRLGRTREQSLKDMTARVGLPPLTQFVNALLQADKMGTSLGKVLRIQSTQMRMERTQRAEKLANQAPVKMLFPLIACIFPTVFMILFGPIVFALMFGQAGG